MTNPTKMRTKEPVRIRFRQLACGSKSIYLDIYRDRKRSYEFLKLYLVPEKTSADKSVNEMTMEAVYYIKAQRTKELLNGEIGLKQTEGKRILLTDWMLTRQERATNNAILAGRHGVSCADTIKATRKHLIRYIDQCYHGSAITLASVDKAFCAGFVLFLKERGLSANTCRLYFSKLAAALNAAYKNEIIRNNPATLLDDSQKTKMQPTRRAYLTAAELQLLKDTPCPNEQVKIAFLFSCLCGLRWSDIQSLTWNKINRSRDVWQVETKMQKTQRIIYLPLSLEARRYLPERRDTEHLQVFALPCLSAANKDIQKWVKRAGIDKHITFHCARHSFATLLLTLGADLYTTSKLLGHSDIKVTQIYAAIVDKKKWDTVSLLNGLLSQQGRPCPDISVTG